MPKKWQDCQAFLKSRNEKIYFVKRKDRVENLEHEESDDVVVENNLVVNKDSELSADDTDTSIRWSQDDPTTKIWK